MSKRAATAVEALCFNVDSRLDDRDANNLRKSGTYHIISASGLHVLILAYAMLLALGLLPISRWLQLLCLMGLLSLYALATGLHPPILRAILMAGILATAYIWRREADGLCALALAGILYLLWSPTSLFNPGFQLSFVAVASLALFAGTSGPQPRKAFPRLMSELKSVAAASLVVTLATAPIVAYHFGAFSLVAVLANVLIAVALPPILVAALLAWTISFASIPVAFGVIKVVVEPLVGWVLGVADLLGTQTWSALYVPAFSPYWMAAYYGAALWLWRRRVRKA